MQTRWNEGPRAKRKKIEQALGFHLEQRVTTGVATINHQEPEMNTTTQIPAPQNESFMWSGLLCGVRDGSVAATVCR